MSGDGGFSLKIAACGCLIDASRYKSEWYVIKVPDPDCRPLLLLGSRKRKRNEKVRTTISTKLLGPISVTESAPLYICKSHLAIVSNLYCFGGLDSDRDAHETVWRLDLDFDSW
nr:hypothetical protein CFP56_79175 [Quercus suber]